MFGATIGFCISPVAANIFMEHIERQALTTFREPPRILLRYVDNVFCAIKLSVIDDFHHHINSFIHSFVYFCVERHRTHQSRKKKGKEIHKRNTVLWSFL